ncbi:DMT family transporter [Tepidibacter hydrothermalis]|uniref:DMT family transporter n=1 Tax=Tepidibacter hydrothermalis TaxID=3036126 RepID=A0ABY8EAM2_9FIRM|nr:DMT family transporter [Tepidibacter hydrothermalis]WFD08849.1 DMT family transporter [Tepidibacter hydrothermalis]
MYKNLGVIVGIILAIMLFFNGMLASVTGPYMSTLIFHVIGLIIILMISIITKNKISDLRKIPVLFLLPGVLSVLTIQLNNICIPQIGITLVVGISLFGQLVMSNIVDHFGLFGMPINKFRKEKMIGFSIISLGIIAMIMI